MNETLSKLKPQYELHLSGGKRALAIFFWMVSMVGIVLSAVATNGGTSELSRLVPIIFPIIIFLFCKEHIEFAFIPMLFSVIKSITNTIFVFHITTLVGYLSTAIIVALIVVIICSLYKKVNPAISKGLAIAFVVTTIVQAVIYILISPNFELYMISALITTICNGIAWFIVYLGIKQKEFTKINWTKLIVAVLIVVVANFALTSVLKGTNSSSSYGCGHSECKENGPFHCYGKNNTCTNKTYCYQDMYCDECD